MVVRRIISIFWWFLLLRCTLIPTPLYAKTIDVPISEDTYVEEKFPTTSPWNNRNLYVGTDTWYGKGKTRILIKPDFSVLQTAQISSKDIEKVELFISSYAYEGTDDVATIDTYTTTSPWGMESVTWNSQPTISSKRDSSVISTSNGRKTITVTQGIIYAYSSYPTSHRGILFKINAETEKSLIFWAHGCDIAPSPPVCGSSADRPVLRVTYRENTAPGICSLRSPTSRIYNSSAIELDYNTVIDPEGDSLRYVGRLCNSIDCSSPISEYELGSSATSIELADGGYYASCAATDNLHELEWSEPVAFSIDTVPPEAPVLLDEPPFLGNLSNQLVWLPVAGEGVQYQLLSSERSDFRSYSTYSAWTGYTYSTVLHAKEKPFYYRVRAKDLAGNESLWSNSTSTIIDTSFPTIKYFKTNKSLLSPKISKSGEVSENAYIQGGIEEENIQQISLVITNARQQQVFRQNVTQKSYLWTHWPEKPGYTDGTYLAQLMAEDSVGNIITSDYLLLNLDTTPPPKAQFFGIKDKHVYTKKKIQFEVRCKDSVQTVAYLSGKILKTGTTIARSSIQKDDGSYTVSVTCIDLAGNKSSTSIKISIDTKPPTVPSITYTFTKEKKQLTLSVYCRETGSVIFYRQGLALATVACTAKKYALYKLPEEITLPYKDTFTARARDAHQNISDPSEKTVFLADSNDSGGEQPITCSALYLLNSRQMTSFSCNFSAQTSMTYQKTASLGKSQFSSAILFSHRTSAKVSLTILKCKEKTFWDPRTWYSCISEVAFETVVPTSVFPIISGEKGVENLAHDKIAIIHAKLDSITVSVQRYLLFSTEWGGNHIAYEYTSPKVQQSFTPIYPKSSKSGYFSWLFDEPQQVSQWHGNTVYQKPHAGIDFSVAYQRLRAPAEGKVVSAGNHQPSKCYGGGRYIGIKHPNGLYTYYFHLDATKYPDGKAITVGDSISRIQKLAKTGSTGRYNCEPLAAHLHFEVRTSGEPKTHLNPIPYFSINWDTIRTARADIYPGRLSGDNPHPKF